MKKLFLMAALVLGFTTHAFAQTDLRGRTDTDSLRIDNFAIKPGGTHDVIVYMDNPGLRYTGVTMYLNLPTGIHIQKTTYFDEDEGENVTKYGVELYGTRCSAAETSHAVIVGNSATVVYSSQNKNIKGTEGPILKVTLACDANVAEGVYTGDFNGTGLTTKGTEREDKMPWEYLTHKSPFTITVMSDPTGIKNTTVKGTQGRIYDLDGYEVKNPVKGRIYVIDGKKQVYK